MVKYIVLKGTKKVSVHNKKKCAMKALKQKKCCTVFKKLKGGKTYKK